MIKILSAILIFIFTLAFLYPNNANSTALTKEHTGSFIVTVYDQYIKVVSPPLPTTAANKQVGVVTDNKTLTKLIAKIESEDKKTVFYLNIPSQSSKKIDFNLINKNAKIIFTPLAPAFQEVNLIFGSKVYEVPPRDTK